MTMCLLSFAIYRISHFSFGLRASNQMKCYFMTSDRPNEFKKKKKTEHTNANGKESRREMEMRIINKIGRNISNERARERQRVRDI